MSYTISVLNHKGGVGKTTVTAGLTAGLANLGYKVLAIDLDFQASLTSYLSAYKGETPSIADVLLKRSTLEETVIPTTVENVFLSPASEELKRTAQELIVQPQNDQRLQKSLKGNSDYDFIFFDHAPGHSVVSMNGLFASEWLLIPISAEVLSLRGIGLLQSTLDEIVEFHEDFKVLGAVITQYNAQLRVTKAVEDLIQFRMGDYVLKSKIRTNTKLKEAPAEKLSVYAANDERGIQDFEALTQEIVGRLKHG